MGSLSISGSTISGDDAVGGGDMDTDMIGGDGSNASGGGIFVSGGFSVVSTTFTNNQASGGVLSLNVMSSYGPGGTGFGGAIYALGSSTINSSTFTSNQAVGGEPGQNGGGAGEGYGGAIYSAGTMSVSKIIVTENLAEGNIGPANDEGPGSSGYGGGIASEGSLTVSLSNISKNIAESGIGAGEAGDVEASSFGGGIYSTQSLNISGTTIGSNIAEAVAGSGNDSGGDIGAAGGNGEGGGIFTFGTTTVTASTITANIASGGPGDSGNNTGANGGAGQGGGICNNGTFSIINSTLYGNQANGGDGGIDAGGQQMGGNGGDSAGGAICTSSTLNASDDTIAGNQAGGGLGAVVSGFPNGANGTTVGDGVDISSGTAIFSNTILSNNLGIDSAQDDIGGAANSSGGYNLIGTGGGLTNGIDGNKTNITNPMLGPLQDNGGSTFTMLPALDSPVIDAGSNALIPNGVTTDQRGDSRISNGIVDIGAVEVQHAAATVTFTPAPDQSAIDGQSESFNLGSFSEANASAPYDVTVNWGDGSAVSSLVLSAPGVIPAQSHVYKSSGTDAVTVTVSDSQGDSSSSKEFQVTVAAHVAPAGVLAASTTFAEAGSSITLTATISGSVGTPAGTVTFSDNGVALRSQVLASGIATLTTSALPLEFNSISAHYDGEGNYLAADVSAVVISIYQPSLVTVAFSAKTKLPTTLIAGHKLVAHTSMLLVNTGATEKGLYTFKYYLSSSPGLEANQTPAFTVSKRISLKQGRPTPLANSFKLTTTNVAAGNYYLLEEMVDPAGLISIAAAPQQIDIQAPFVQLSASVGSTMPAVIGVKRTASLFIVLANSGNIAASGLLNIVVNPSSNGSILSEAIATYRTRISIKAGGKKKIILRLKIPTSLSAGSYLPSLSILLGSNAVNIVGSSGFEVN